MAVVLLVSLSIHLVVCFRGDIFMSDQSPLIPLISRFADDPDMADLVEMFIEDLPERMSALSETFQQQQFADLQRIAHQIKGAGGGYGYPELTEAASDLETQLKNKNELDEVEDAFNELLTLCKRVMLAQ